jgi:AcrR family transcriptional regulator
MVPDGPSPLAGADPSVGCMRTDGAGRVPRATPVVGSGTTAGGMVPRHRLPADRSRLAPLDGRVAKGEKTRKVLVEAVVALIDEGALHPTSLDVAERAGVSVRVIYHHFRGMPGLLLAAVDLQSLRHRDVLFAIPAKGPAILRVRALCRQRRLYFEEMTPVYRVAYARAQTMADLRELLADDRALMRLQLADTLSTELPLDADLASGLLDAMEHNTGWDMWLSLRDSRGHTAPSAERVMAIAVERLLG